MNIVPAWIEPFVGSRTLPSAEAAMNLALEIACASARNRGGPFGAVLTNQSGELVEIGWNYVIESCDSTAHAEALCIRRAQAKLHTHDLSSTKHTGLTLYSSAAPCIQCYGIIYWSGLKEIVTAATIEVAEASGFDEGPVSEALWNEAQKRKGINFSYLSLPDKEVARPFQAFAQSSGKLY